MSFFDFIGSNSLLVVALLFHAINIYKLWNDNDDVRVFKRGINTLSFLLICILATLNGMRFQ